MKVGDNCGLNWGPNGGPPGDPEYPAGGPDLGGAPRRGKLLPAGAVGPGIPMVSVVRCLQRAGDWWSAVPGLEIFFPLERKKGW